MIGSRFLWKLYAGYAAILIVVIGIAGIILARETRREALEEIEQSLHTYTFLLEELSLAVLQEGGSPSRQETVRAIGTGTGVRITVIDGEGTVLADADEDPGRMEDHGTRPEILDARDRGVGTATRLSETTGTMMMYHALSIRGDRGLVGYVRCSLSVGAVDRRLDHLRATIFWITLSALVAGLLFSYLFVERVVRPIRSMAATAASIARGEDGERVRVRSGDEIGDLAESFNTMATKLEERVRVSSEERNRLLAILGGMVEGVVAVDGEERIVHMNRAAGGILGAAPADCVGRRAWETIRVPLVNETLRKVMEERRQRRAEIRISDGMEEKTVELHAAPLENGGAVLVLFDVSDLRRLESVRRDFVASVSHELKTPITAIRGLVETILDDGDMQEEIRDRFLEMIAAQSTRLSNLVSDLLDLSRIETKNVPVRREPLDLRVPVQLAVADRVHEGERKGLTIEPPVCERPLEVMGDGGELRRMVDNLLGNAIRYTAPGGRVAVRVRREGKNAVVEVEDNGIGIDRKHHERIFERFYRVDKARSREMGGTGLGLSIVKHIALSHGAAVTVESRSGEGSLFCVRIPLFTSTEETE